MKSSVRGWFNSPTANAAPSTISQPSNGSIGMLSFFASGRVACRFVACPVGLWLWLTLRSYCDYRRYYDAKDAKFSKLLTRTWVVHCNPVLEPMFWFLAHLHLKWDEDGMPDLLADDADDDILVFPSPDRRRRTKGITGQTHTGIIKKAYASMGLKSDVSSFAILWLARRVG